MDSPNVPPEDALRTRLAAAAEYGRAKIADTGSPCARDLCWYLIRLSQFDIEPDRLDREVRAAEHIWLAAMEVERLEQRFGAEAMQ
jgi:hypothetical protein